MAQPQCSGVSTLKATPILIKHLSSIQAHMRATLMIFLANIIYCFDIGILLILISTDNNTHTRPFDVTYKENV